ncbi:IreB family regulatory phosphoprotein [Tumebacillus sp. DT12]|uniref:IreB family regulatory phosphoprotein n=1 Tax=Tumebacillus lacus TaxID=2995335 RepID=A0ABT3X0C4_9BACL|nr:IreB family regulatory phosphoprotein [Tumebacillus lacus]MCX7570344.1 IreB family regulatory phosphoprotein [Tumebacillus lacus]
MTAPFDSTIKYGARPEDDNAARRALLLTVDALKEKGYNPISQLAGYIISGDPAYITNHNGARNAIRRLEREDLLEELVRAYMKGVER